MNNKFSKQSKRHLAEAHIDLQEVFGMVIDIFDCRIIEGHRGKLEQNKLFHAEKSKVKWPNSKHNKKPSHAVDAIPSPIDWSDPLPFYHLAGVVKTVAFFLGVRIRWGGDWDSDGDFKDQSFDDLAHYELVSED